MAYKKLAENRRLLILLVLIILTFLLIYLNYMPTAETKPMKKSFEKKCYAACSDINTYFSNRAKKLASTDMIIILDHSRSMLDNNKLERAKSALMTLPDIIKKDDRVSIIVFDNSSQIIQNFTKNKSLIKKSIMGIKIGHSTKYIPALQDAYYNFLKNGKRSNKWTILFVSDGEPKGENVNAIYSLVKKMTSDGICINTIGYGKEITKGSAAEKILENIAYISEKRLRCGGYYYAPKDADAFASVLGTAYKKTSEKSHALDIKISYNSLSLPYSAEFVLSVRLSFGNMSVPGRRKIGNRTYCAPEAEVSLKLYKSNSLVQSYPLFYSSQENAYLLKKKIDEGAYEAYISYELKDNNLNSCGYFDSVFLGVLNISPTLKKQECKASACSDVRAYVLHSDSEPVIHVTITDYAFIPQNITIKDHTTIVWTNYGKKNHTVTSGKGHYDGLFNSGIIKPGQSFNITFDKGRPVDYFDNLSVMTGKASYSSAKDISLEGFTLKYNGSIDIALLIDSSESMHNEKIENAKQASIKLVNMLYPGDNIAIVSFNEQARIIHKFTDDKQTLSRQIKKIYAAGSTSYLSAFEKLDKLFSAEKKGKIAILLSDGKPWDSRQEIYKKAKYLADNGICVYTIGYGSEINDDNEAREILTKIAKISQESKKCGRYYYAPSDETRLIKIFGSIYYDNKDRLHAIKPEAKLNSDEIYDNETLVVVSDVVSKFNNRKLPGKITLRNKTLCAPPAHVVAEIRTKSNMTIMSKNMSYNGLNYRAEFSNIPPGEYAVYVNARTKCSDYLCDIVGSQSLALKVKRTKPFWMIWARQQ